MDQECWKKCLIYMEVYNFILKLEKNPDSLMGTEPITLCLLVRYFTWSILQFPVLERWTIKNYWEMTNCNDRGKIWHCSDVTFNIKLSKRVLEEKPSESDWDWQVSALTQGVILGRRGERREWWLLYNKWKHTENFSGHWVTFMFLATKTTILMQSLDIL